MKENRNEVLSLSEEYRPIIIPKATMDLFLSIKNEDKKTNIPDVMALYNFYYYTAEWQKTNQAKCNTNYTANGLNITEDRVRKAKKKLVELGLITIIQDKKTKGQFADRFIRVNFKWRAETVDKEINKKNSPCNEKPYSGEIRRAENNSINALSNSTLTILKNSNVSDETEISNLKTSTKKDSSSDSEKEKFPKNKFMDYWLEKKIGRKQKPETKGYQEVAKMFKRLAHGNFLNMYPVDKKFLAEFSVDVDIIKNKMTDEDIYSAIDRFADGLGEGSEIYGVEKVKKDAMANLLFHPKNKKSYFLRLAFGKQKKAAIKNKDVYNKYKNMLGDKIGNKDQGNLFISCTNGVYDEVMKIYKKVERYYSHTSFSSYFGSSKNPMPFFDNHINYLKTKNNLSAYSIKVDSFCWNDFVKYAEKTHGFVLYPDKKQIENIKRDYERAKARQERYKSRGDGKNAI
jgi:hypothetical protein